MKRLVFALVAALLIAGQVFSPALASDSAAQTCGDTYTVQRGEYLSLIARKCGVSLSTLIARNPQITNINRIFPGQVIRITADGTIPVTGTYVVKRGEYLSLLARRFGTTTAELLRLNPEIRNPSLIFVGQVIRIPSGTIPETGARVTLSATSVRAGNQVTVRVFGFPANTAIDLRIGRQGQPFTSVVDANTDARGEATVNVTIPSAAAVGEKWVVRVQTTELTRGVEVTSPVITIVS